LKVDKKAVKILRENLNEEKTFGSWLERNNPRLARKIMRNQLNEKQKAKEGNQYYFGCDDTSNFSVSIKQPLHFH
jgi:hypothetical protein